MSDHEARRAAHLERLRMFAQQLPPGGYISHHSAALVHGLPTYDVPVAVQVTGSRIKSQRTSDLHVHRATLLPPDVTVVDDIPVTSIPRTVVDIARGATFGAGLVTADAALRRTSRSSLSSVLRRQWTWPRIRHAMPVVRHADRRSDSALESYTRGRFLLLGLPIPELQAVITGPHGWIAQSDFRWKRWNVVGEADGKVKYVTDELWLEKLRQDAIEDAGYEVIRWTWRTAHAPDDVFTARLWRKLRRGRMLAALDSRL